MAYLGKTFDATAVEPAAPIEVLPAGKYKAQIVNSEMRQTKDQSGEYLYLEIEVLEGQYASRKLWDRLNLVNSNQQAVDIANRALSAICHATGKLTIEDSEQLHYIPMTINVRVRPSGPDKTGTVRDAQNEIRGYEKAEGSASARPAAATAAKPQAPWRRQ